ncbi:MAG: hypothetical protein JSV65_09800 [Armatimonadota bacterium]|nr:MAG: hypothetical protein JSV65_09800 [Armatimonadota bacterium]
MSVTAADRATLRDLAERVAEIAAHPQNAANREEWKRHNGLKPGKAMVLVFPEGAWQDLLPDSVLTVADPTFRRWEWHLRHIIYRWEHLRDDNVIEPRLKVGLAYSNTGWGMDAKQINSPAGRGAWAFDPVIKDPEDARKLKQPALTVDEKKTQENFETVRDVFGDILEVNLHRRIGIDTSLIGTLVRFRGLDQIMLDMCDRPQWLHDVMTFMTEATERLLDQVEQVPDLSLNNGDDYVGSGGVGYTDDLPGPGFDGRVRLRDLWGFAEAQELALVSPAMHEEFVLQYQGRLLDRFGLSCYGCCEDVTHKLGIIQGVPRLRRVSVSPWTDLRAAAEALQNRIVFSWKPNPAPICLQFDADRVRREINECLDIADGCIVEMILKDTHTVRDDPDSLSNWVKVAGEVTAARA